MRIISKIRELFDPEPNLKKLSMNFWCQNYKYISGTEIKTIVSLVFHEFHEARKRDLYISHKELKKEISFWLNVFESNKGINAFYNKFTLDSAKEYLVGCRKEYFSVEINSRLNLKSSDEYSKYLSDIEDAFIKYIFKLPSI